MSKATYPEPGAARPPDMLSLTLEGVRSRMYEEDTILELPARRGPPEIARVLEKEGFADDAIERIMRTIEVESAIQFIRSKLLK